MKRIIQFFKDSYAELRKVTWPSKDEVLASTRVIILVILLVALLLGVIDVVLFQGIDFLFKNIPTFS